MTLAQTSPQSHSTADPPVPDHRRSPVEKRAVASVRRLHEAPGTVDFSLVLPSGRQVDLGSGPPVFTIVARTAAGLQALASFDGLTIAHAYLDRHLDLEGDVIAALSQQERLRDFHPWLELWRRLHPILVGRHRTNPQWISLHYDAGNAHLHAADRDYHTYTPGIYQDRADTLEVGAERKLAAAFEVLRVGPGQTLLDVGCGWGGMSRYSARRGVKVTAITLSRRQKEHVETLVSKEKLPVDVRYQDFFTFTPDQRFDAISMMGVIEDLSDYRSVMRRLDRWLKPGGRVYLDFAAERRRFGTHSFVTKYIWPGTFRMVFMPEFVEAVRESPFEIVRIDNDRANYHLWCRALTERWTQQRARIVAQHGEVLWRKFLLLYAGVAALMNRGSYSATAYRVVLELPSDSNRAFWPTRSRKLGDPASRLFSRLREAALYAWPGQKNQT